MRRFIVAGLLILACVPGHAQSRRPTDGPRAAPRTVAGRVLTQEGDPVRNARVAAGDVVVLTEGDGRFQILTVESRLHITKAGYAPADPVAHSDSAEIRLSRGASISGRVLDTLGEPVAGLSVVLPESATEKRTSLGAVTDDLGEYRIGSLPAGTYSVRASGITATNIIFDGSAAMLPTEMQSKGYRVTLGQGEERTLDLTVTAGGTPPQVVVPIVTPQRMARGSATLRGRVAARNGRPLAFAQVRLTSVPAVAAQRASQPGTLPPPARVAAISRLATANREGLFELHDLPAARYRVAASRTGYSALETPAEVSVSEDTVASVDVVLDPDGAIAGVVTDELGDPLEGVQVEALHIEYRGGQRRLLPATGGRRTDDRGAYRLFGLPPGDYVVTAAFEPTAALALPGYARAYFPGTDDAVLAQFVRLDAARVASGTDVPLSRTRTARIAGRIVDGAGNPTTGGRVQLIPSQRAASFALIPTPATISDTGEFEFKNVAPGQYIVQADRGRRNPSTEGEFGSLSVPVDGRDISGLVLQMTAGAVVRGQLTMHARNNATAPAPATFEIAAVPADFDDAPAQWASSWPRPDGSFQMEGLHGARRLQVIHPPAGWMVEAVRVNGADATDAPVLFGGGTSDVEVVVTDRAAAVFGSVVDDRGRAAAGAHVFVFPSEPDNRYPGSRYFAHVETQTDGTFSIAALPSGNYNAVSVAEMPEIPDGWQDPQLLESFERQATPLTLRDSGAVSLRLRLARP